MLNLLKCMTSTDKYLTEFLCDALCMPLKERPNGKVTLDTWPSDPESQAGEDAWGVWNWGFGGSPSKKGEWGRTKMPAHVEGGRATVT